MSDMTLERWLELRRDAVSRELLHLLRADELSAVRGENCNLLGLEMDSFCGAMIRDDIEMVSRYASSSTVDAAQRLLERARVVLYG